jgi:hypothetical protein
MATRTIVTSQPDVECELCARRLLRGEQHEVFLAAGRPRTVCELCAPRAADAGWIRDRDGQASHEEIVAPRRGRGILERLRLGSRAGEARGAEEDSLAAAEQLQDARRPVRGARRRRVEESLGAADLADLAVPAVPVGPTGEAGEVPPAPAPAAPPSSLERAAAVFNGSEYPRRVAGLMRSLGAPAVCIRPAEHLAGAVRLTLAWELCWYRYEVDLTDDGAQVRPLEQGTELGQLSREERHANAHVAADGTVFL